MKTLILFLAACGSAFGQWSDFSASTAASNLYNAINARMYIQTSAGSCATLTVATPGKDGCYDSTNHVLYLGTVAGSPGTWKKFLDLGQLGALSTGLLKSTTSTGALSIGVAGTDFESPITAGTQDQLLTGLKGLVSLVNCVAAGGVVQYATSTHTFSCHTLVSGDIPNNAANTTGNAATATALDHTPTLCSTGQAPTGILASGAATGCASLGGTLAGDVTGASGANTVAKIGGVTLTGAIPTITLSGSTTQTNFPGCPVVGFDRTITYSGDLNVAAQTTNVTLATVPAHFMFDSVWARETTTLASTTITSMTASIGVSTGIEILPPVSLKQTANTVSGFAPGWTGSDSTQVVIAQFVVTVGAGNLSTLTAGTWDLRVCGHLGR